MEAFLEAALTPLVVVIGVLLAIAIFLMTTGRGNRLR
jgi:hypothetical protein